MEIWYCDLNDGLNTFINGSSYSFEKHSEYDANSCTSNCNDRSPSFQDWSGFRDKEDYNNSNEINTAAAQTVKNNEENEKSVKFDEKSSSLLDKNKQNENKSTRENSGLKEESNIETVAKNSNKEIEIKIEIRPKSQKEPTPKMYFKFEEGKKYWKTTISQSFTDCLNDGIEDSELPKELKNKMHKPNSKLFTANVTEIDNSGFLELDLKTILTKGKEKYHNQEKNEENIQKIYEYFEKIGYNNLSEKMLKIKYLFEMKYKDFIKKFYESEYFNNFKNEEYTIFYDEGTRMQEGFKISEDYGLLKIFMRKGKKRRDKNSGDSA